MEKDPQGSQAYCSHGVVQEAMKALKDQFPELYLIGDVCMCEYTSTATAAFAWAGRGQR